MASSDWKLLRHSSNDSQIPPLLLKYEFGKSNYKVWVTDLAYVWTEVLEQRPLVQRAWDTEADIDPIESDQRQMLLQRIRDSLDAVVGTKLVLSKKDDFQGFAMTACSPLPKPFKQLRWPFLLAQSPAATLSNELLLPLLREQLLFRKKVTSLLAVVETKDHIIGKLTDKMQAEGIELGKVFPGAISSKPNRKASSKADFEKSVKGLSSFSETQWQSGFATDPDIPTDGSEILSRLLPQGVSLSLPKVDRQRQHGAWWEQIHIRSPLIDEENEEVSHVQSQSPTANRFQEKSTPSSLHDTTGREHLMPMKMTLTQRDSNPVDLAPATANDSSTTETSDEDLDIAKQGVSKTQQPTKQAKDNSSSSSSCSPEPAAKSSQRLSPKFKGVLGRIGGGSKPSMPPSKPVIGRIGGAKTRESFPEPKPKSPEQRGRPRTEERSSSPIRETSQERADKKREQLKRELEEKSKLGAKKKRKF
ncbi:MAG: hypothetical protein Q9219_006325 [cf. Caloplaca sp. 3 TL-2023]